MSDCNSMRTTPITAEQVCGQTSPPEDRTHTEYVIVNMALPVLYDFRAGQLPISILKKLTQLLRKNIDLVSPEHIEGLFRHFVASDRGYKKQILSVLGRLETAQAKLDDDFLLPLLNSEDWVVRWYGVFLHSYRLELGGRASAALLDLVKTIDTDAPVAIRAVRVLGETIKTNTCETMVWKRLLKILEEIPLTRRQPDIEHLFRRSLSNITQGVADWLVDFWKNASPYIQEQILLTFSLYRCPVLRSMVAQDFLSAVSTGALQREVSFSQRCLAVEAIHNHHYLHAGIYKKIPRCWVDALLQNINIASP